MVVNSSAKSQWRQAVIGAGAGYPVGRKLRPTTKCAAIVLFGDGVSVALWWRSSVVV